MKNRIKKYIVKSFCIEFTDGSKIPIDIPSKCRKISESMAAAREDLLWFYSKMVQDISDIHLTEVQTTYKS